MQQHKFEVSQEFREKLNIILLDITTKKQTDILPEYPDFVSNLFKEFNTPSESAVHAALGIGGEAGEITDAIKKVWAYNKPVDAENVLEELGDLHFYFTALANMFGFDLHDIEAYNMDKLSKRYHEGKFTEAQANARADKA